MKKAALIGFFAGVALYALYALGGPYDWNSKMLQFILAISLPMSYVVSWITGWSFHQEEGLMVLTVSVPATFILSGILVSVLIAGMRKWFAKPKSKRLEIITKEQRKTSDHGDTSSHVPGSDWGM